MTRGKYAARAAQSRAESAGARADKAAQALAAERAQHAAEVADLKARIEKLSSQLTGKVSALAAAKVRRVEAECAAQVAAVREQHHTDSLEVFRLLARATVFCPALNDYHVPNQKVTELVAELAQVLHVPAGEAHETGAQAAGLGPSVRATRRADAKKYMASAKGQQYVVLRGSR